LIFLGENFSWLPLCNNRVTNVVIKIARLEQDNPIWGSKLWTRYFLPEKYFYYFHNCCIFDLMTRNILIVALSVLAILVITVFGFDISLKAIAAESGMTTFMYLLTESAGKYGTFLILLVTCLFYTRFIKGADAKLKTFASTFVKLILIIGSFAFVNEHILKKAMKSPRPSHTYVVERSGNTLTLESFYNLPGDERGKALKEVITKRSTEFKDISVKVLDHWVEESGYSFPSGHSFNAFLLAFVLSYCLRYSRSSTGRKLYFIPLLWALLIAISRVAIGAHTKWDVSFGAMVGIAVAAILMHYDLLRKNILHRDHEVKLPD
jgi:phosphatidylglycerophosphatase B